MRLSELVYLLFLCLFLGSCKQHNEPYKIYDADSNVIKVGEKVKNLDIEEKDISIFGIPYVLNKYLIISDYKSPDKLIHIFDKHTFDYITSVGDLGVGPGEIANMGSIVSNEKENTFYVIDHGRQKILGFQIDSVLCNADYKPVEVSTINRAEFPSNFQYINDTLAFSQFIKRLDNGDYKPVAAKWNMKTGETVFMDYTGHPLIERKRVSFASSAKYGIYIEAYWYHDLMSLCSLDGNLKCNLYGTQWNDRTSNEDGYFNAVAFCGDKIIASYLGGKRFSEGQEEPKVNYPKKFLVFDLAGNHLATLDVGIPMFSFCYDADHNRIIMAFDNEIQFGYLDLDGLL